MHSRAIKSKYKPSINGKIVDLDLLYRLVTSRGGWEKVNSRNEWDDLLEHFHLPKGTNGGLVIKSIYLKYLENYERVHFLGEDGGGGGVVDEDDFLEDARNRRRAASKMTSTRSSMAYAQTPTHHHHHHHHHHHGHHSGTSFSQAASTLGLGTPNVSSQPKLSDGMREQLGLPLKKVTDYDKLILSLQSPLPNEQDVALSVCTLLSNETKHVLHLSKAPALLIHLLAHTGIYQDCGLRSLYQETYVKGREMSLVKLWDEMPLDPEAKPLLCESYVKRIQGTMGIDLEEEETETALELEPEEPNLLPPPFEEEEGFLKDEEEELPVIEPGRVLHHVEPNVKAQSPVPHEEPMEISPPTEQPIVSDEKITLSSEQTVAEEKKSSSEPIIVEEKITLSEPIVEEIKTESTVEEEIKTIMEEIVEEIKMETMPIEETTEKVTVKIIVSNSEEKMEIVEETNSNPNVVVVEQKVVDKVKVPEKMEEEVTITSSIAEIEPEPVVKPESVKEEEYCCPHCPCNNKVDKESGIDEFSAPPTLARTADSTDKEGRRVQQVSAILRNLSFEEDNKVVMARNLTMLRYLLITGNCSYGNLMQDAFDTLGNIAGHIQLQDPGKDPVSSMLLSLLLQGLYSDDRFKILRSLDAIRFLPKTEKNEKILESYLEKKFYSRLCDLLTICDIMLLYHVLETLLSISGIGDVVCNEIVRVKGSVANLVSLVTVEAQSYGPKGCILMRVVETVTNSGGMPIPVPPTPALTSTTLNKATAAPNSVSVVRTVTPTTSSTPPSSFPGSLAPMSGTVSAVCVPQALIRTPPPSQQRQISAPPQLQPQGKPLTVVVNSTNESSSIVAPAATAPISGGVGQVSAQSLSQAAIYSPNLNSENVTEEAWASAWLSGGFEQLPGTSTEEGKLYAMYTAARKKPLASLLSQAQLVQCVKLVYGANVGPVTKNFGSTSLSFIEGIRPKINLTPPVVVSEGATNGEANQSTIEVRSSNHSSSPLSPILKATLSRPPTPKSPSNAVVQRQQAKLEAAEEVLKMNGERGGGEEESSGASSSLEATSGGEDNTTETQPPVLTFQGVIQNGTGKEGDELEEDEEEISPVMENGAVKKGMLVDLLERKELKTEGATNGIVGSKEIRISEKGLEIVEQQQQQAAKLNNNQHAHPPTVTPPAQPVEQKMTFYASPEVGGAAAPEFVVSVEDVEVVGTVDTVDTIDTVDGVEGVGGVGGGSASLLDSNGSSSSHSDFLEKFNQFSDLIVVNPEQLGLKRPAEKEKPPEKDEESEEPPAKKSAVLVNGLPNSTTTTSNSKANEEESTVLSATNVNFVSEEGAQVTMANSQGQLVQVPLRLSGGKLVLSPSTTTATTTGSGQQQVIISKGTDPPKAYIFIPQTTATTLTTPLQTTTTTSTTSLSSLVTREGLSPSVAAGFSQETLEAEAPFLCEWAGCGIRFNNAQHVFMHAVAAHCPAFSVGDAVRCEWGPVGCDPLVRKRFSLMTHLQDRHCTKQALELACYRRKNKIEPPPPPVQPVHHPGYAPNAAFHAIKRHALQYMNPKELTEENEGPVTKSIRLTSALILRNLVNFSPLGRRMIGAYESQLATIAMSNVESSRTVAQLLHDISESPANSS